MSTPYLSEKVSTILTMAIWYVRLGRSQKAQQLFWKTIEMIEQEGGIYERGLHPVLEEYANRFRRAGRLREADKLSELAQRNCAEFPDTYYADGSEIPWWKRADFQDTLPPLPITFQASHAESGGSIFLLVTIVTLFVGGFLLGLFYPVLKWLGDGTLVVLFFTGVFLSGIVAERGRRASLKRKRNESWCRLSEDGVEYHEPHQHYRFRWSEIQHVWTHWESLTEDTELGVVVVKAGRRKFQMSARFFTEQEVKWVDGICKLKTGVS